MTTLIKKVFNALRGDPVELQETAKNLAHIMGSEPLPPDESLERDMKREVFRKDYSAYFQLYNQECSPLLFGRIMPNVFPLIRLVDYKAALDEALKECFKIIKSYKGTEDMEKYQQILENMAQHLPITSFDLKCLLKFPAIGNKIAIALPITYPMIFRFYKNAQAHLLETLPSRFQNSYGSAIPTIPQNKFDEEEMLRLVRPR